LLCKKRSYQIPTKDLAFTKKVLIFLQVLMTLCIDGNTQQQWDRHRPSRTIFEETQISGYQFRSKDYPNLCLDYSKIKKKGKLSTKSYFAAKRSISPGLLPALKLIAIVINVHGP